MLFHCSACSLGWGGFTASEMVQFYTLTREDRAGPTWRENVSVLQEVDALLAPHLLEAGVGDGQPSQLSGDTPGVSSEPA